MTAPPMLKYPRTHHLEGSRLQPGDEDLSQVRLASLRGIHLVVEEKLDGANAALSFATDGTLLLQSRGHYLTGGLREKHFALFKTWAATHQEAMRTVIGDRYIVFGEWLYAKHTVYYDALPHWFMEFDVWDRQAERFLTTPARHELLAPLPIAHVPVIHRGPIDRPAQLAALIRPSLYKTPRWRESLAAEATRQGLDVDRVRAETDPEDHAEGLYIKHETDCVVGRYKFIRQSFLQAVITSDSHWLNRPIVPNRLHDDAEVFG
ncbi:MAG: RNA ligase family protein [Polyangiaceae bacterium]